jgi:hypothetical protein
MSQRLLFLSVLIAFFVLPVWSQPHVVATSDMPEATAFNNGHKLAVEGWALQPARIHAVFTSSNDVFHSFSTNLGSSWSSSVAVSQTSGPSRYPAIVRDSLLGGLFAVWQDSTPGQNDIYLSSNQGGSWSTPINVSNTSGQSVRPSLDADRLGRLHLVYADNSSGNYDIYYQRYESGAWSDTLNLSRNTGLSDFPSIGAYGDDVYVCWEDNSPGNFEIFERHWNGTAWSTARNLSQSPASSRWPSLSCPSYISFPYSADFSVTWVEADTAIRVIGPNGGGAERTRPCDNPVISNIGTTWAYLSWQDRDSICMSGYYFMNGHWSTPVALSQGHYPSLLGSNLLYTQGVSGPYQVMFTGGYYPIGIEEEEPVCKPSLILSLHPNPSAGLVRASLSFSQEASLSLVVYDLQGAVIRTLARAQAIAGLHEFHWDGRDDFGHKVPSGVYLLRASAGSKRQTARVLLLR